MPQIVRKVNYEWDLEEYDEHGDIIDHRHSDIPVHPVGCYESLVLVRDSGISWSDDPDHFEIDDRQWAYVVEGLLPKKFDGGATVPKRFHAALKKIDGARIV